MCALRKDLPTGGLPVNRAILDVLVPAENFDFAPELSGRRGYDPQLFKAGRYWRQIFATKSFQELNGVDWGSALYRNPQVITTVACLPYNPERIRRDIDMQANRTRLLMTRGGRESQQVDRERALDHGRTILELLGRDDERMFKTTIYQQLLSPSLEQVEADAESLRQTLNGQCGVGIASVSHNQQQAFFGASPLMHRDTVTVEQCYKPMPSSTLAASLPFSKTGLDDGTGTTIGTDSSGALVRLDMTRTSQSRSNCNIVVLGKSGKGKSTLMQKIILDEIAKGVRVIIIDPEREHRALCERMGGQWINVGGGSSHRLSPLRPRARGTAEKGDVGADYQEDTRGEVLASTVATLKTFFRYAFHCTDVELGYLEKVFREVYGAYGITYDTARTDIRADQHPEMSEIYDALKAKGDKAQGKAKDVLTALCGKLWPAIEGSTAALWGGRSNLQATADFIVLDTAELSSLGEADLTAAQYFNVLTWVWDQVVSSRDRGRKIRLVIDEAHLILGKQTESAAAFVAAVAKRIRKYNGGLMIATQQIEDLMGPAGVALLNQAAYRFLLPTDAVDLSKIRQVFELTESVTTRLREGARGYCVAAAEAEKVWTAIQLSALERRFMGIGAA
jgi:GTPase SAR1 family protein